MIQISELIRGTRKELKHYVSKHYHKQCPKRFMRVGHKYLIDNNCIDEVYQNDDNSFGILFYLDVISSGNYDLKSQYFLITDKRTSEENIDLIIEELENEL